MKIPSDVILHGLIHFFFQFSQENSFRISENITYLILTLLIHYTTLNPSFVMSEK